jgi:putative transposase
VERKRHIGVDMGGRRLMIDLTTADISDSVGLQTTFDSLRKRFALKHLTFEGAPTTGPRSRTRLPSFDFIVEIVRRSDLAQGFPRRWIVDPTLAWKTRWRRLVVFALQRFDCLSMSRAMAISSGASADRLANGF